MLRFLCLDSLDVVWCGDFSIVRVRNTIWKDRVKSQQALKRASRLEWRIILYLEKPFRNL